MLPPIESVVEHVKFISENALHASYLNRAISRFSQALHIQRTPFIVGIQVPILYTINCAYPNGVSRNLCSVVSSNFEFTQFIRISSC